MPLLRSRTGGGGRNNNGHQNGNDDDAKEVKYKENPTSKSIYQRIKVQLIIYTICSILLCSIIYMYSSPSNDDGGKLDVSISEISPTVEKHQQLAPMGKIIYGAKSKGDDTARLVTEAINSGFRHIATVRVKDNIRGWSVLLFVYLHDMMFAQGLDFFRYLSLIDMVHNRVDFTMNTMKKE